MNEAVMSECKNPECRSKKDCVCGGHNNNNHKKNKNHNSTKVKLLRRRLRQFFSKQKDIDPEFVDIVNDNFWDLTK